MGLLAGCPLGLQSSPGQEGLESLLPGSRTSQQAGLTSSLAIIGEELQFLVTGPHPRAAQDEAAGFLRSERSEGGRDRELQREATVWDIVGGATLRGRVFGGLRTKMESHTWVRILVFSVIICSNSVTL